MSTPYLRLYAFNYDSYKTINEAIESGALYHITCCTTLEVGATPDDLDNNSELLNAIEVAGSMATMLGWKLGDNDVELVVGTDSEILFVGGDDCWIAVDPIKHNRKV